MASSENTRLISSLPEIGELNDSDVLFCMRGSVSYKLPGSVVKALALGGSAKIEYVDGVAYWFVYDPETGTHVRSEQAQGPEGPKITGVTVNSSYHLIVTLSDGSEYDAGYVRGPAGAGTGDMLEEDYDSTGAVKAAGGIAQYVKTNAPKVTVENNVSSTSTTNAASANAVRLAYNKASEALSVGGSAIDTSYEFTRTMDAGEIRFLQVGRLVQVTGWVETSSDNETIDLGMGNSTLPIPSATTVDLIRPLSAMATDGPASCEIVFNSSANWELWVKKSKDSSSFVHISGFYLTNEM